MGLMGQSVMVRRAQVLAGHGIVCSWLDPSSGS